MIYLIFKSDTDSNTNCYTATDTYGRADRESEPCSVADTSACTVTNRSAYGDSCSDANSCRNADYGLGILCTYG